MYYDIYTMKNGTDIRASKPDKDGSFYIYAIRYTSLENRHFWDNVAEGIIKNNYNKQVVYNEPIKVLQLLYQKGELEYISMNDFMNSEDILLYHFIINPRNYYHNCFTGFFKHNILYKMLCSPVMQSVKALYLFPARAIL